MPTWTKEEDEVLTTAVRLYGVKAWSIVACALRGRTGKQCRERYYHWLVQNKQPKASADRRLRAAQQGASSRGALSASNKPHLQDTTDTSYVLVDGSERTPDEDFGDELQVSSASLRHSHHGSCIHCYRSLFCRSKRLESG